FRISIRIKKFKYFYRKIVSKFSETIMFILDFLPIPDPESIRIRNTAYPDKRGSHLTVLARLRIRICSHFKRTTA
ncbi:MAG: hypothetical protein ACK55Z_37445, partial [bacterium]